MIEGLLFEDLAPLTLQLQSNANDAPVQFRADVALQLQFTAGI